MLSIQEMVNKTEEQRKQIEKAMDSLGYFHPDDASILRGQKPSDHHELKESLETIPLSEFLAKSSSTGIAGAARLVPDALHTKLMAASKETDKVPLFAAQVVNGWAGGDLLVDIAKRKADTTTNTADGGKWSLQPKQYSGGGRPPEMTVATVQATVAPVSFTVPFALTNTLREDVGIAPDLVEWHVQHAAHEIGQYATDLALNDLLNASDGDGAQQSVNAGSGTTTAAQLAEGLREVGSMLWNPDTVIVTYEAWEDQIKYGYGYNAVSAATAATCVYTPPAAGYDGKWECLDIIFNGSSSLHSGISSGKLTACVTIVIDRSAALLSGRKRWMQLENFVDPPADLSGAVVSCRQDNVTLYKDAQCKITES